MEDILSYLDIYYQINSYDDIQEYNLNNIKNNPYFLIESKNVNPNIITFEFIENMLFKDGVDLSKISEFRYLKEEEKNGKTNILLKPLSDNNLSELKYLNQLYLHLIIEEETETSLDQIIINEMDDYNLKIEKYEKDFKEISLGIEKEELYNQKVLSDNLFKNIEKRANFQKDINNEYKTSKTMIKKNFPPLSNSFFGIAEEDIFDEENKDIVTNLSDKNNDAIFNTYILNKFNKININNNMIQKRISSNLERKEKSEINLCYLYSNPLNYKDKKKIKTYENNDCFNEISYIYKLFKDSNIPANLRFEPIINNFNTYLESTPDILHINVNSISRKNLEILLDYLGDTQYYRCKDLKTAIGTEYGLSQIKLLILSTQNIKMMKTIFNNIGIKNIIYIENKITYPEPNERIENFVKELYKNLLKDSIQEAFKKSKRKLGDQNSVEIFPVSKKGNDYIILPKLNNIKNLEFHNSQKCNSDKNLSIFKEKSKNIIKLNKNCSLNLDFVKYNYRRIIGRNIELKYCIEKLFRFFIVSVCGYIGAGKKSFIQLVGKFAFERKMFQEIHYIEIYFLRNAEEILRNKKNEIKENMKILDENQSEFDEKKILLIINIDYIICDENDISIFEELIGKINDNYFHYLLAFTINNNLSFIKAKKKLQKSPLIELGKFEFDKRQNLFYLINYYLKNIKLPKAKEDKLIKSSNGFPNQIYLRALFINLFKEEINNLDFDALTNEIIFNKLIEKYGKKIKKIFSVFSILKLGIREDILQIFFDIEEIDFIKKNLKYLIFEEIDEIDEKEKKNYTIDSSFKDLIIEIMRVKYPEEFLSYLNLILKNYAIIFRYLVDHTNYPYNFCFEFHAGINKGFWLSVNDSSCNKKFFKEYKNFKDNNREIYFDEVKYFNNVLIIFIDDTYIDMMKKNLTLFIEYISQISICLPTLLHFQHNYVYEKRILEVFKERLGFLNLNKSRLRLKIFMCWFTEDSNLVPNDVDFETNLIKDKKSEEIERLNNDLKAEIDLIKIYDFIKKKDKENYDISGIYNECLELCQKNKNNFNLAKLNILYGMTLKNKDNKIYFVNALKYANEDKNVYMRLLSLIMEAEYYLSKYEFDRFNEKIAQCENEIKCKENKLHNTDINNKLDKVKKDKDDKYKKHTKNKLFFFTSSPFFDENRNPLKTESNNSFYLKYNLITELPKNLKIEIKNIGEDFLEDLEKCLYNPVRFLYIGSDQYNEEGSLFYTKDFKGFPFKSELIKDKLDKSKNKCEIVILGFLNSEKISEYFLFNKFPHVIYIKKIKALNKLFKFYTNYYFYFQRCFYIFISEFLSNLSKKYMPIKEAFNMANNVFIKRFLRILDYIENEEEKDKIGKLISNQILVLNNNSKRDNEIFFDDFEDLNNQSFSSSSSSLLNLVQADSKNSLESTFTNSSNNNIFIPKTFDINEEKKDISKDKEKKYMEFLKFPKGDLTDDIFEKLYNDQMYGMKEVFKNLIKKILKYRIVNIYGNSLCGKTRICLELCKYFYMNNYFKEGIFYLNINKLNKINNRDDLKSLNKNNSKNKKNEINDILLIFDDFNLIKGKLYSYINKLNSYVIIITKEK